jgi:D-sedoheptulose 7-phosphate isomerase
MPDITEMANAYVSESVDAQRSIDLDRVTGVVELLLEARESGRTVYVIGNGGSAATASHAATDFLKTSSKLHGKHTRAIAVSDSVPVLTAISNDSNYESSFTEQVNWFGESGDILLAISASGNSPNIISAVHAAKSNNMTVVGLSGFGGGKLSELADISVVVDSSDYGPVEDAHMMIIHLITRLLQTLEMPVSG